MSKKGKWGLKRVGMLQKSLDWACIEAVMVT